MPTPSSIATPSRAWCAGSPIRDIGAVAGNAKVGNRINMITRWQALEYIVAQNLERRALSALDTLTVVPGAVGAWRRERAAGAGRLSRRHAGGGPGPHHRHPDARAIGCSSIPPPSPGPRRPPPFRGLAKQRFRWAYGTLQCLWKYRRITFNPRYGELGLVALPQVWLFQILLTTLAPVADLLLVWQLIGEYDQLSPAWRGIQQRPIFRIVGIYYGVFMVVDLLAAMIGFVMEQGEDWSLLWWLLLQRFGYRQIMYYVRGALDLDGAARPLCRLGQAGAPRHGEDRLRPPRPLKRKRKVDT